MGLLPRRAEETAEPDAPRVLDLEGEEAAATFDALGSETAREILATVYEQPRTLVEIREQVGTSLQNVHYHIERLEEADLLEPAGMGYSEKGNEMTVYGPASEALVLFAGDERQRSRLDRLVGRVLGLYFLLAVATVSVHLLWERFLAPEPEPTLQTAGPGAESGGGGGVGIASEPTASAADAAGGVGALDPAVVFFLGGLVALCGVAGYWYLAERNR